MIKDKTHTLDVVVKHSGGVETGKGYFGKTSAGYKMEYDIDGPIEVVFSSITKLAWGRYSFKDEFDIKPTTGLLGGEVIGSIDDFFKIVGKFTTEDGESIEWIATCDPIEDK